MRIVIAGCREYNDYNVAKEFIDLCLGSLNNHKDIVILSGGARGADELGLRYAVENSLKTEVYRADWEMYGRAAGPKRNEQMAKKCDIVICFWDGKSRGTKSMIDYAQKYNRKVYIKYI